MISPSIVIINNISKPVKNLGWLLKHWKQVDNFRIEKARSKHDDCYLIAYIGPYKRYETGFASYEVCINFLNRPVFKGLILHDEIKNVKRSI